MTFRKKTNRHDQWAHLLENNKDALAATGLPTEIFADESRFNEFLVSGRCELKADGTTVSLGALTDDEFLRLESVVNRLFDSEFFAFDRERLRRFKRYG
jgi:hypothetical protein